MYLWNQLLYNMENYSYNYKYTNVKTIVKRKQITIQTYIYWHQQEKHFLKIFFKEIDYS